MKFIIIGLGNPGKKYDHTRHNAGFMVVEELSRRTGIAVIQQKHQALIGKGRIETHEALLAKPQTFMNESGRSAALLLADWYLTPESLIVLHDDLDLPLGNVRIKQGGGHGGHNGLRSIIQQIGTAEFMRIRIGIGRPAHGIDPADYVLSPFSAGEKTAAAEATEKGADAVLALLWQGPTRAMNLFNQK